MRTLLAFAALALLAPACSSEIPATESSSDDLVASFHRQGITDLTKTTHILLVGDSAELAELPLYAATTRARRYVQLYPNDQIVVFVTKDVSSATVAATGATVIRREGLGEAALADLSRLTATILVAALRRFTSIASIDFFGHSSPFGALLEGAGDDRVLSPSISPELALLASNFALERNPYVTLNGCNGGVEMAPKLSRLWHIPVSGALSASNFEVPMSDGRWYPNDPGRAP